LKGDKGLETSKSRAEIIISGLKIGNTPGVGDYNVEKVSIEIKPKSPKACIGRASRFNYKNRL